jgi:hypothetical protein
LRVGCRPDVDCLGEGDTEKIRLAPVHNIEVEIVSEIRGIQDFKGQLRNFPLTFLRQKSVFVEISYSLERVLFKGWNLRRWQSELCFSQYRMRLMGEIEVDMAVILGIGIVN